MTKIRTVVIATAFTAMSIAASAGFLDGLKKIGDGVASAASSAIDSSVNIATSAVQRTSNVTVDTAHEQKPTKPAEAQSQNVSARSETQSMTGQTPSQFKKEQTRRRRMEEERESRYQADQERQRKNQESFAKAQKEEEDRERAEREKRESEANEQQRAREEKIAREKAEHERIAKMRADADKAKRDADEKVRNVQINMHKEAAGAPGEYKFDPIPVYKGIKLGMSISQVCDILGITNTNDVLRNASDYNKWIGGKATKIPLSAHTLWFQFAPLPNTDHRLTLISAQLSFNDKNNAPEPSDVCAKYMDIPGIKHTTAKEKHGNKFRDGTPMFWKVVYWKITAEIEFQNSRKSNGMKLTNKDKMLMASLAADVKTLESEIIEDIFREVDVFEVDGMQICVKPNTETKKTSIINFEDKVISCNLESIKTRASEREAKAEADAKAKAEKNAKNAAINF